MRFFEYQDQARWRLTLLLGLFALVVVVMIALLNLLLLYTIAEPWQEQPQLRPPGPELLADHTEFLLWTTGLAILVIAGASLWRLYQLHRAGGGRGIVREMGGEPVGAEPEDAGDRRLRNIVEEMAIAAGLPVPAVFVLERELGINAFAAGFTPGDAAIAVTRGAIESLNRQELKAVVAHEFGHILQGDMRLNTQLIGILYGIEMIALAGLGMLPGHRRRAKGDERLPFGFSMALVVAGFAGLLAGRLIRTAISRQQEHRADAHAVQFTRNADGMAGALHKVAARYAGLASNPAVVGHMLFANGAIGQILDTHPPLEERLARLGYPLDEEGLERLGRDTTERVRRAVTERGERRREREEAEAGQREREENGFAGSAFGGLPGVAAAALLAALPGELARSARNPRWASELALYLVLHPDPEIREQQLLMIAEARGAESEERVRQLRTMVAVPDPAHRLPLLEMAFPAVAGLEREERRTLAGLIERMIHADGRLSATEYALGRMLMDHLAPGRRKKPRGDGKQDAGDGGDTRHRENAARYLLASLALHGHPDDPEAAEAALIAGLGRFTGSLPFNAPVPEELRQASQSAAWARILDRALERLERMPRRERERLLEAMDDTIRARGEPTAEQRELVRMMAGTLHLNVPLPDPGELFGPGYPANAELP